MQKLGIPYMGSKRKLSVDIIDFITRKQPQATKLYDIFGGGGAISFTALQFPQFKDVIWNDVDPRLNALMSYILNAKQHKIDNPELYKLGQIYEDKLYQWISREEFNKNKERLDWYGGYVQVIWSFANKGSSYLFGKDLEETKRLGHNLAVFGTKADLDAIRAYGINIPDTVLKYSKLHHRRKFISQWSRKNMDRYDLERLQQLQQLEQLNLSYLDIDPKSFETNSIVYLDPPYENTAEYKNGINHKELYEWIDKIEVPVYLSSYKSPLQPVLALNHRQTLNRANSDGKVIEWLFWNGKDN